MVLPAGHVGRTFPVSLEAPSGASLSAGVRFLAVTETCDLGSLYLRLLSEGHEVRVSASEPLASETMAGLVPRVADWELEKDWVREAGADGIVLFEAVGFGGLQDKLRSDGFNVIGGSALGDQLEANREFAQGTLARRGAAVPKVKKFSSGADALSDLRQDPRRCVFKRNASAGETFVGVSETGEDIKAVIEQVGDNSGSFILMDHVEGVEIGVGAYFNGNRFLVPACVDWEHKRFFPGDMGELTGEMGTVATFAGSGGLFDKTLKLVEDDLREAGHVGYVNINTIVNEEGVWPIEFTCRFGYPGFAVLEPLQALDWGALFHQMLDPTSVHLPARSGFCVGVVLTTPPFPWSRHEVDCAIGMPFEANGVPKEHLHLGEVGMRSGRLVTSGLYGWTAVVTGVGESVLDAQKMAYSNARKVHVANLRYREDIGDRLASGDLDKLKSWGWL